MAMDKFAEKIACKKKIFIKTLLDMIFPWPDTCIACEQKNVEINSYRLCISCWHKMPFITCHYCSTCGKQLSNDYEENLCPDCRSGLFKYDFARSVFEYNELIQHIIYSFKYKKDQTLFHSIGDLMTDKLYSIGLTDIDYIIPVPLHRKRLRERGFNQAQLLAKKIGYNMSRKVLSNNLVRIKYTSTQTVLNRKDRETNLIRAFHVNKPNTIKNKRILLIDDIYTTGATVNQCSKVLKENGASKVYILTFATGKNT